MSGRRDKNIVDFFSHQCESGKTMFILESKYGHKGYAVWFKTLELLGRTENHYFDCRSPEEMEYLSALMKVSEDELIAIYDTCAKLNAIHSELWENRIIWSLNFVKGLTDVYRRRGRGCMDFLQICQLLAVNLRKKYGKNGISDDTNSISTVENHHSRVE
jgi:hypothetical protein